MKSVQVIGFCALLHRTDLLKRFVRLIDNAGYVGDDTLYEDLLCKALPNRHDVDQWYHDVYSPLVQAIYIDDSKIDHMVYPKDLVEYARSYAVSNSSLSDI
jgi:hypothetical protein